MREMKFYQWLIWGGTFFAFVGIAFPIIALFFTDIPAIEIKKMFILLFGGIALIFSGFIFGKFFK